MDEKIGKTERSNSEFVSSLARGLSVIQCFGPDCPKMTLTEVAERAGLTRAAARRFLLTLAELGFAKSDGKHYELTPRVLSLGYAYLSSLRFGDVARVYLEKITKELDESSSIAVLDKNDIVYVARSAAPHRIMSVTISVGTRLPVHATSMGQVLLTGLEPKCLEALVANLDLEKFTGKTLTKKEDLIDRIQRVRKQGYALVDQELEEGLRSIAVPIFDGLDQPIAALNISAHTMRVTQKKLRSEFLPVLKSAAEQIGVALRVST